MLNQQEAGSAQQDSATPVEITADKWLAHFALPNMIQYNKDHTSRNSSNLHTTMKKLTI